MEYDVIVVGAGSAGIPLAVRLSENPNRRVLLVESGSYYPRLEDHPIELRHGGMLSAIGPGHPNNWSYTATLTQAGLSQPLPRGRVVGGSSSINGTLFERGLPEDFDAWAAAGCKRWSFEEVLPIFRRIERDLDFHDERYHGSDGPIPIRRIDKSEWPAVASAFFEACLASGVPEDPDKNDPNSYGIGPLALNAVNGIRMSTALTYLPLAEGRANLTIAADLHVTKVRVESGRAVGIEVHRSTGPEFIGAGEVIVSAGAVGSPQLLMLSGIGSADDLRQVGIEPVLHSPLVGREFNDHCTVWVNYSIDGHATLDPIRQPTHLVGAHITANGSEVRSDLMLMQASGPYNKALLAKASLSRRLQMLVKSLPHMTVRQLAGQVVHGYAHTTSVLLMKGCNRGQIRLVSADPYALPELYYRYLEDPFDRARLREGLRFAASLLTTDSYKALGAKRNAPTDEVLADDRALDHYVASNLHTAMHMSSSARMGMSIDDSVVDESGRVHGIDGLRVADTSIWPDVVRRSTNATAVMTGERIADLFLEQN